MSEAAAATPPSGRLWDGSARARASHHMRQRLVSGPEKATGPFLPTSIALRTTRNVLDPPPPDPVGPGPPPPSRPGPKGVPWPPSQLAHGPRRFWRSQAPGRSRGQPVRKGGLPGDWGMGEGHRVGGPPGWRATGLEGHRVGGKRVGGKRPAQPASHVLGHGPCPSARRPHDSPPETRSCPGRAAAQIRHHQVSTTAILEPPAPPKKNGFGAQGTAGACAALPPALMSLTQGPGSWCTGVVLVVAGVVLRLSLPTPLRALGVRFLSGDLDSQPSFPSCAASGH